MPLSLYSIFLPRCWLLTGDEGITMQECLTPNECLTSSLFWPPHVLRSPGVPQLHAPSAPALPLPPDEDSWILWVLLELPSGLAAHGQSKELHLCSCHLSKYCSHRPGASSYLLAPSDSRWHHLNTSSRSESLQTKGTDAQKLCPETWGFPTDPPIMLILLLVHLLFSHSVWATQEQWPYLIHFWISCV